MNNSQHLFIVGNPRSVLFRQRAAAISAMASSQMTIIDTGIPGPRGRLHLVWTCLRILVLGLVGQRPVRIVFHGAYSPILWLPALLPRIQVISILQGSELNADFRGVRAGLIKLLLRSSHLIVCRSDSQAELVRELCELPLHRCEVIHWGLDERLFAITRPDKGEEIVVISPRATRALYNIPVIFEAVRLLKEEGYKVRFVYVEFNAEFQVAAPEVADSLLIEPSQEILWSAISDSDLCISIPSTDGLSNTIIETLAVGTFPIFNDLKPYGFLKADERLGKPVKLCGDTAEDIMALQQAIREAIRDIDAVREHVEYRRTYALTHYQHGRGLKRLGEALKP